VITALFSGFLMAKGFLPEFLPMALFFFTIIAEIILIFARDPKFGVSNLKPATFYAYAICFGSAIGFTFKLSMSVEERLL
jgi:hypothetical protein